MLHELPRCLVDGHDVVAVHDRNGYVVSLRESCRGVGRLPQPDMHVAGEEIVLDDKQDRGAEGSRQVEGLLHSAFLHCAVAQVAYAHVIDTLELGRESRPNCQRHCTGNDRNRTVKAPRTVP